MRWRTPCRPVRRVELHRQVLRVLADLPDADPGRLVHHAWLAGDHEAVLRYGQIAGNAAARQGAHREATRHYQAAAAYADRAARAGAAPNCSSGTPRRLTWPARTRRPCRPATRALAIRERLGQAERIAENLRWISQLAWWTGRVTQMREAADRALEVLDGLPPNKELAMAYVAQAQLRFRVNDLAGVGGVGRSGRRPGATAGRGRDRAARQRHPRHRQARRG